MSTRLLVLFFLMGLGLVAATVVCNLTSGQGIMTWLTVQDLLAFIVPALVAMALCYRRPLHVMRLDRAPGWKAISLVVAFYIISLPAMNWLIEINQAMSLPSWLSGTEEVMRSLEDSAADATKQLFQVNSVWDVLVCILVVGLLAGLSEEMLYRGAMLRIMQDSRLGTHAVVWIVAIIFSAIHMQFYGFLPRMLLGAWFGYLMVWTRSLWVPIIAHDLNNTSYVILSLLAEKGVVPEGYGDRIGLPAEGAFPWLPLLSLVCSIAIVIWAHRQFKKNEE